MLIVFLIPKYREISRDHNIIIWSTYPVKENYDTKPLPGPMLTNH